MSLTTHGAISAYNPDIATKICERIAAGDTISSIGATPGFPSQQTFYRWLHDNAAFFELVARARAIQAAALVDQSLQIADEAFPESGSVAKATLQVKTRQWTASKHAPKTYGDATTLRGDAANPIAIALSGRLDELEAERLPVIDLAPLPASDKAKDFL